MSNVEQYYRILELEPGATLEEIRQGYKDLAMVWHPDRFPNHPRLRQKAHKKLQLINEAHEKLRSFAPVAATIASPPQSESARSQPSPSSPSNSKDYYKQPPHKPQEENYRNYTYEYTPFKNFSRKDVDTWLD
ncbi:J domain-containing protein [Aerosakkonema sp. BLCC-F183]|uniref:J domain-containing protein n=1 Tax=Aerosakkonema sp. BLCC-F183 TaxID=3342834 RepID=UPI0035B9FCCE